MSKTNLTSPRKSGAKLYMGVLSVRIKELRKQKKLTQEEIATRLGVGRTTYLGYENGKIGIPAKRLEELADLFGVSIDYISGKIEHKTVYEKWDSEHDSDALSREVMVREFVHENLGDAMKIIFQEMESRGLV